MNPTTVLRIGKPVEHLQAALKATLTSGPAVEVILAVARQIAYFIYLSYDLFVWVRLPRLTILRRSLAP